MLELIRYTPQHSNNKWCRTALTIWSSR